MSDATKRALRTVAQVFCALVIAVPVIAAWFPDDSPAAVNLTAFGAILVSIARLQALLEDNGVIPVLWRDVHVEPGDNSDLFPPVDPETDPDQLTLEYGAETTAGEFEGPAEEDVPEH